MVALRCVLTNHLDVMTSVYSNKVEVDFLMFRYLELERLYTLLKKKLSLWRGYLLRYQKEKHMQKRKGLFYAFRPNVYTDREEFWRSGLMDEHPDVQFHDYTKNPLRMLKYLQGKLPKNYHLTFSRSEDNEPECLDILSKGGNVAVVFNPHIPKWYEGYPVITGDETDLRHLDPKGNPKDGGYVIGLLAKGSPKSDKDNFVIQLNKGDD